MFQFFSCWKFPSSKTPKGGDRLSFAPHIPLLSRWSPRPRFSTKVVVVGFLLVTLLPFFVWTPPPKKKVGDKNGKGLINKPLKIWGVISYNFPKNESCGYSYDSLDSRNDDVDIFVLLQHLQFRVEFLLELVLFFTSTTFRDVRLSVWSWICPV